MVGNISEEPMVLNENDAVEYRLPGDNYVDFSPDGVEITNENDKYHLNFITLSFSDVNKLFILKERYLEKLIDKSVWQSKETK